MNKLRREDLTRAVALIADAKEIIEGARDEEQESFENLPEGIQMGERGEAMEQAADRLTEALDQFDEIESAIEEAKA